MMKTVPSLLCAALALTLLVVSCEGGEPNGVQVPLPLEDGGVLWGDCTPSRGTSACGSGEVCRFVEHYGRSICVPVCDPQAACGPAGSACCAGGEDAGAGGYCLPLEVCEALDAGTTDAGRGDGGSVHPVGDAGPGEGTDAGDSKDAGIKEDAGSGPDAGPGVDAGTESDAGTDAGSDTDAGADAGSETDGGYTHIRIMASNLTSGNLQSYDPGHGINLMKGVAPDVILIQEFNYGDKTTAAIRTLVDKIAPGFEYYREGGAQIPNGIISRWPIIESGEWTDPEVSNRDFAWARIDIPGPRDLWAVSVHLLTSNATERNREAVSLVNRIKAQIPSGDYLTIGGDFNTKSRTEACFGTFSQVVVNPGPSGPFPVDRNNNGNTSAARDDPYDHVMVDADLRQYQTATVIQGPSSASTFPNGLVLDSRVYAPLSEIAPVQSGDSRATNMQHMGVVRDFLVPNF